MVLSFSEQERFRLSNYRNRFIQALFHKASSDIINYCLKNHIGKIVVGYNVFWKQRAKLSRRIAQNFQYVPFHKLLRMIEYKVKQNSMGLYIRAYLNIITQNARHLILRP